MEDGERVPLRSTCPPLSSLLLFTSGPAANKNTRERGGGSAAARCPLSAPATLSAEPAGVEGREAGAGGPASLLLRYRRGGG